MNRCKLLPKASPICTTMVTQAHYFKNVITIYTKGTQIYQQPILRRITPTPTKPINLKKLKNRSKFYIKSLKWVSLLGICALAGCTTLGPDYQTPQIPTSEIPTVWHAPNGEATEKEALQRPTVESMIRWWEHMNDPLLITLIRQAQQNSPSLAKAQARLQEAWASQTKQESTTDPRITGNLNQTTSKGTVPSNDVRQTSRAAQLALSWELDFFGSRARGIEATEYRTEAREMDWHDARITLASEVASQYVQLRNCQATLAIIEKQLTSQKESAELIRIKVKAGFAGTIEETGSQAALLENQHRKIQQAGQCELIINTLALLIGKPRDLLTNALHNPSDGRYGQLPTPSFQAIPFTPAHVVLRRPDVASIERELAASRAEIGAAVADRYPKINLSGLIGLSWLNVSGNNFSSRPWSISPGVSVPILDGGAGAAQVATNKARFQSTYASYIQAIRSAINDVENSLSRIHTAKERAEVISKAAEQYDKNLAQQNIRYRAGFGNLIELEEIRRQSLNSQINTLNAKTEKVLAWIALYKAVGGDWQEVKNQMAPSNPFVEYIEDLNKNSSPWSK